MKKITYLVGLCFAFIGTLAAQTPHSSVNFTPRARVIIDNDFSGDPDGLYQLAHHLLSPSVEIRAIIGSHLRVNDGFDNSKVQAENAAAKAKELVNIINPNATFPVFAGSNTALVNDTTPIKNAATAFIIQEALRTDTKTPLFVVCGAGLTEIASALLAAPQIAEKLTLIWIGGSEYPDLAVPPPNYSTVEYNLNIDIAAARVVFNRSQVPIWQVPRNAYRQCLMPFSQLLLQVKNKGKAGNYLFAQLEGLLGKFQKYGLKPAETYVLGDSPLVLLTALQAQFESDPSSSDYVLKQSPLINQHGTYEHNHRGRLIRVYTRLDTYLMFSDLLAKLELASR